MDNKQVFNNFAYNALTLRGTRPDNTLMVDTAERKESIPVLLFTDFYENQATPIIPTLDNFKNEQITPNFEGVKYSEDMFPTDSFYLGSLLDGGI